MPACHIDDARRRCLAFLNDPMLLDRRPSSPSLRTRQNRNLAHVCPFAWKSISKLSQPRFSPGRRRSTEGYSLSAGASFPNFWTAFLQRDALYMPAMLPPLDDRRQTKRRTRHHTAWITLDDDIRSFDCNVLDISKGGGSGSPNTRKRRAICGSFPGSSSRVSGRAACRSIRQHERKGNVWNDPGRESRQILFYFIFLGRPTLSYTNPSSFNSS